MTDFDAQINQLEKRLAKMVEYQEYFYREINQIREEIKSLKISASRPIAVESTVNPSIKTPEQSQPEKTPNAEKVFSKPPVAEVLQPKTFPKSGTYQSPIFERTEKQSAPVSKSNLEEFIGRNLISLIGIIITILGVGIGAKYAIDRDLISPATRINLGYLFAVAMLGIAVWLKKKYLNFSAVLLSGSLAMMYFLTFFAYSYYALLPQRIAFAMMLGFTAFTVVAAINYNRQVVAHIGLVGAYAVPFLLSENSGRADILFSYMAIINFGILAISVKKFWKSLFYSSFVFTWLIFAAWFISSYRSDAHFTLALGFSFVFFLTFYLTFLSYKLIAKEEFNAEIVVLVFVNSFVFYGFGYAIIESRDSFEQFTGLFTLANALLNFLAAFVIHKYKLGDKKNLYLAITLAITFTTIAVPVQFQGNWVTLLWTAEFILLFYFGRTKSIGLFENLSFPLMFLASVSLLNDWQNAFFHKEILTPVFNADFLTSILFAAAFAFIVFVNRDERYKSSVEGIEYFLKFALPSIFLFVLYNAFRVEIGNYYHLQLNNSEIKTFARTDFPETIYRKDGDLNFFNIIWQINYSMLFLTILSFVNIKKIKSESLGLINLALNFLILLIFLSAGLYLLSELRTSYLLQTDAEIFPRGAFHILFRYVSLAFAAALIYASYEYIKREFIKKTFPDFEFILLFDFVFHVAVLWIVSSELINLLDIFGIADSYKLGLSILWGVYALLLIILGIVKRKQHLRIGAIVLFALTLVKLFLYDIADLDTISKTVVFVSLGILLLIISFLYNKYKNLIFENGES